MTAPTPEMLEARKWCIETALGACENPMDAPGLAAALVQVVEHGGPPRREKPDFSRMKVGSPEPPPADAPPYDFPRGADEAGEPDTAPTGEPQPQIGQMGIPRLVPRIVQPLIPDGPELTDKEQAVLAAILRLSAGGGWPTHAQMSDASEVPRGSLGYVLERLLDKGYLARADGKWAVVEREAG